MRAVTRNKPYTSLFWVELFSANTSDARVVFLEDEDEEEVLFCFEKNMEAMKINDRF